MKMLLLFSDPELSALRKCKPNEKIKLDNNMLEYLVIDDSDRKNILESDISDVDVSEPE